MPVLRKSLLSLLFIFLAAGLAWASITGSISGIVSDPSGAVIPGATITVTNTQTGLQSVVQTDDKGFYNFPDLPVGTYSLQVEQKGFKEFVQQNIVVDANSAIRADVHLEVGAVAERVTVSTDAVTVETQNTQMGEVITGERMTAVPLNGRDFTDLLALQPGVVPNAYSSQAPGLGDRVVGGDTQGVNSGTQSINGQRETANGFMVNGANVEEGKNNGTAVIPNLDSIAEFRIITNNFDAEYGNYSGGQVNVVTKQGTNTFHGDLFEFNRNTDLNAINYFAQSVPKFIQNQFGGTFGGPIHKDSTFFFVDYQGSRQLSAPTQTTTVPDGTFDSNGDYNLSASQSSAADGAGNQVQGDYWANILSNRLGYPVADGEPYFGCDDPADCVFPNDIIPHQAFSSAAVGLIPYIPVPNASNPAFNYSVSTFSEKLRDDKIGLRIDQNTRWGMFSAYYHGDDDTLNNPFPNGGATVASPNIGVYSGLDKTRSQLFMLSFTKSFGSTAVNEARVGYVRSAAHLFSPQGGLQNNGTPITLAGLGFTVPGSSGGVFNGGIAPVEPALEGVPNIGFNQFSIGVPSDTTKQFNNMYQAEDSFTKIFGTHSIKFGAQFHYDQINDRNFYGENGSYGFDGSETGLDFSDFLIGAPSYMIQATIQLLDTRSKYFGAFAQDSWRVTPNLTFNYGVRWEFSQPWYDTGGKLETLIPGVQSVLFPGAPTGWLVPGDPGVPSTLAPTKYNNFSPRLGIAYSPGADSGWLAALTGGPGKTSIRAGYGIFYTAIEDLTQFQEIGDAPYGLFYVSPVSPLFESPYIDRATGNDEGQRFPFPFPPANVSATNPDTSFNWAGVEPIIGALAYNHNNVLPYSEDYELSIQRQFGANTVASISYVGTQSHKLLTELEANPGNQQLCLQLNEAPYNPDPGNQVCGSFGEGNQYTLPFGVSFPPAATPGVEITGPCNENPVLTCNVVNTTYTVIPPQNGQFVFGNDPYEITAAQSSFNSLQASIRHNSGWASFLFGYTYSHCIDDASGLQEGVNPFDPKQSLALCVFDVTHNFTSSYEFKLPFDRLFHLTSGIGEKLTSGWSISGITTFATGLPVNLRQNDDLSLTGTQNTEAPIDVPEVSAGKVLNNTNPRSGLPYFNSFDPANGGIFSPEPLGQIGNSPRRFFHGPGLNNWDLALTWNIKFTESKTLELRGEAFNAFNHAQFYNPDGTIDDGYPDDGGTFGLITGARAPRIMQLGLKFHF
ncbi:MAG TPA: TonB-dependent receptor [Candidatus Limnocylindrales bacterium]|nr:TonB-dependent receptor [Candidatus Limnocylindrales bacterium]